MAYDELDTDLIDLQYNDLAAFRHLLDAIEVEEPKVTPLVEEKHLLAPRRHPVREVTGVRAVLAL